MIIKDSFEHDRLTQNIFDFVKKCTPGFVDLLSDTRKRPFERKIKNYTKLQRLPKDYSDKDGYGDMYVGTGTFSTPNDVKIHFRITIFNFEDVLKRELISMDDLVGEMGESARKLTHLTEFRIPRIFTTSHAVERWQERSHMANKGTVNTTEYEIVKYFTQEFQLRGDPCQTFGGIPVDDGVFLGEWLQLGIMKQLGLGAFLPCGFGGAVVWNHKSKKPMMAYCFPSKDDVQDTDWFFFAKTFISWNECSFNQAILGKQILNNPEIEAQRFRRSGSQEWLPGDKTTSVVPTDWAKEFGITQH